MPENRNHLAHPYLEGATAPSDCVWLLCVLVQYMVLCVYANVVCLIIKGDLYSPAFKNHKHSFLQCEESLPEEEVVFEKQEQVSPSKMPVWKDIDEGGHSYGFLWVCTPHKGNMGVVHHDVFVYRL